MNVEVMSFYEGSRKVLEFGSNMFLQHVSISPTKIVLFLLFTIFVFFEVLQGIRSTVRYTITRTWVWSALLVIALYEADTTYLAHTAQEILHNLTRYQKN